MTANGLNSCDDPHLNDSLLSPSELKRLEKQKLRALKKQEIRKLKNDIAIIDSENVLKKPKETSKKLMYLILLNCMVIELYSMIVMVIIRDLSALYSLIGAVVTSSVTFAIYCAKAYKGKKSEVEAKLQRDMFEAELNASEFDAECPEEMDDNVEDDSELYTEDTIN